MKKTNIRILTLILCVAIVASIFAGINLFIANAETNQKSFEASKGITIDGEKYEVEAKIRYSLPLNPTESNSTIVFNSDTITIKVGEEQEVTFYATIYDNSLKENETIDLYSEEGFVKTLYKTGNGYNNEKTYSGKVLVGSNTRTSRGYFVKAGNVKSRVIKLSFYAPLIQEEENQIESLLSDVEEIKNKYLNSLQNISEREAFACIEEIIAYLDTCSNLTYDVTEIGIFVHFDFNYTMGLPLNELENKGFQNIRISNLNFTNFISQSDNKSSIITLQPNYNDLPTTVFDESAKIIENTEYDFSFDKNLDNEQVTIDEMMTLSKYSVVIIDGHGGNWTNGYVIALSETVTTEKRNRYTESGDLGLTIIDNGGCFVITEAFFDKYYNAGALANTMFYLGTCHGGDVDVGIRDVLLAKGMKSSVVLSFRGTVVSEYNRELIETISKELSNGQTINSSVETAKDKHGVHDPYLSSDVYNNLTFWGKVGYNLRLIESANPAELILSGDSNWSLGREYIPIGQIALTIKDKDTGELIKDVLMSDTSHNLSLTLPQGYITYNLREGIYNASFSKDGYETVHKTITIKRNTEIKIDILMTENPAGDDGTTNWDFIEPVTHQKTVPKGYIGIYTAQDLDNIRNDLTGNYILMNDIDLASWGKWEPIGKNGSIFKGVFDGNGYKILNFKADETSIYIGLFGIVESVTIKNTALSIDMENPNGVPYPVNTEYIGGLIAYILGTDSKLSTVTNCFTEGTMNVSASSSNSYIGGIAACAFLGTGKINNCFNQASIVVNGSICYVGGIVGGMYALYSYEDRNIENCFNSGEIVLESITTNAIAGGIIGEAKAAVTRCYNNGSITINSMRATVGGIAGTTDFQQILPQDARRITNCHNAGNISVLEDGYFTIGGVIGSHVSCVQGLAMCYNIGEIPSITGTGGLAGKSGGYTGNSIGSCYALKNTSSLFGSSNATLSNTKFLSSQEMQDKESFTGFNFDTIWDIDPSINSGYPYLR